MPFWSRSTFVNCRLGQILIRDTRSFHLDHAAALTYIMEKVGWKDIHVVLWMTSLQTNFKDGKGKVYMTHPTKAVHKFMMQDFVRMRFVVRLCLS